MAKTKKSKGPTLVYKKGTWPKVNDDLNKLVEDNNLKWDEDKRMIELNKHNSEIIENLIKNDYAYIPFAEMVYDHFCNTKGGIFPTNDEYAWTALARIIDIDNSTQEWRYSSDDFHKIIEYIMNSPDKFKKRLVDGDAKLVDDLRTYYFEENEKRKDKSKEDYKKTRDIKSLASKICKYTSEFMGYDNYFVNDYYVRNMLPFYLDYYMPDWHNASDSERVSKKTKRDELPYETLWLWLDKLLNKVNENKPEQKKLTRSELDHIIWYGYKRYDK